MAKKNHLERIKDLIELNMSDIEIKNIIYNEYGIYFSVHDIHHKRKPETTKKNIINTKTQLEIEVQLVRNILLNYLEIPLKKNEIVELIYKNKGFIISSNEVKRILWSDLKKEIIYNSSDWTYRLRNEQGEQNIVDQIKNIVCFIKSKHELNAIEIVQLLNRDFNKAYKIEEIKNILVKHKVEILKYFEQNISKYQSDTSNEDTQSEIQINYNEQKLYKCSIDGYSIVLEIVSKEMAPLYWAKVDGLTQYIYLNEQHPKSKVLHLDSLVQLLIALGRTSLSFSDNSGEMFFNRLKNYIDLT